MSKKGSENTVEVLQEVEFSKTLGDKYLSYALSTIVSRSLPDVRDGLKPVHRRILYSMLQLKLDPKLAHKKSARIVGDIIGKYHPHGDSSVYSALVRMAQSFATRHPVVDGQGNFGSVDGDNPAAMRYTEAKLTPYAMLLLKDINQNAVDFRPNYDNSDNEPVVLPSAVPNILVNGTEGIAVGMATSIPPHNLKELCDATIKVIKTPNVTVDSLCNFVKGPDFPTGGVLVESEASIKQTYAKGKGSFRLRAKWHKEDLDRGQYRIIITEIPYQVTKRVLIEKMAALFNDKKLPFLESFQDMSAEDISIILYPKSSNIEAEQIMESLFRLTDLEIKFHLNLNVLDSKSVPRVMSLKEVLEEFINHRRDVTIRKNTYRLQNINKRLEILAGLLVVYLNLDEVIRIIREEDDAKAIMMKKWQLTDNQVEAILNTRLRTLRKLEEFEIRKENEDLTKEKKEIEALLADEGKIDNYIVDELKDIKKLFSKDKLAERKTEVSEAEIANDYKIETFVEKESITFICSKVGWVKAYKGHNLENIKYKVGDSKWKQIECCNSDKIVFFSNFGKAYTLECAKVQRGKGDGDPIRLLFDLKPEEKIITAHKFVSEARYLVASKDGKGFIADAESFVAQTKTGRQLLNCKPEEGAICSSIKNKTHMAIVGENRRLLVFEINEIPSLQKGKGVTLQKYKQGKMLDIKLFNIEEGLKWKSGKRTQELKDINFWTGKRASMGRVTLSKIWVDKK